MAGLFPLYAKETPQCFFKDYAEGETIEKSSAALKELLTSNPKDEVISELLETLKKSGNLPYEYREILAAYFLQELHINHLAGASFFEEAFIDYAPATNYGYWLHYAAFGTSSKDNLQLGWNELIKKKTTAPKCLRNKPL